MRCLVFLMMILPRDPDLSPIHMGRWVTVKCYKLLGGDFLPATMNQESWSRGSVCFVSDLDSAAALLVYCWTVPHHNYLGYSGCFFTLGHAWDRISCFVITTKQQPFNHSVCNPFVFSWADLHVTMPLTQTVLRLPPPPPPPPVNSPWPPSPTVF